MMSLVLQDNDESKVFWATAHLSLQLATWGATVSSFFHSCPLSTHGHTLGSPSCKGCPWKGRMAVMLSQGLWLDTYANELVNLPTGRANYFLERLSQEKRSFLVDQYAQCKLAMAQRLLQVFGFWNELPWRICAVAINLFYFTPEDEVAPDATAGGSQDVSCLEEGRWQYIQSSKSFAADCLRQWGSLQRQQAGCFD